MKRNFLTDIDNLDFSVAPDLQQFDVSHNEIAGTVPNSLAADSFITVVRWTGTDSLAVAVDVVSLLLLVVQSVALAGGQELV